MAAILSSAGAMTRQRNPKGLAASAARSFHPRNPHPRYNALVKRIERVIFNILTSLLALLCVACAGLWVRSYWFEDTVGRVIQNTLLDNTHYDLRSASIESTLGQLRCSWVRDDIVAPEDVGNLARALLKHPFLSRGMHVFFGERHPVSLNYKPDWKYGLTFHFGHRIQRSDTYFGDLVASQHPDTPMRTHDERYLYVPDWFVVLLTVAMPLFRLGAFIRRRRIRPGFCHICEYDLRASKDRCSECGTENPAPAA